MCVCDQSSGPPSENAPRFTAEPGTYDGRGANSAQWWPSRYGEGDELGAGNELTPERTLAALALPTEGRIVELARTLDRNVPIWPPPGVRP